MWLNDQHITDSAILCYSTSLLSSCPRHIVIDGLFSEKKLNEVLNVLQQPQRWQAQKHIYSALYVDDLKWRKSNDNQRFVQRDVWSREATDAVDFNPNAALEFLSFLRGDDFMYFLSRIFKVALTDINVADPKINTNYFRLGPNDFVRQHADDSPGREVCMLLYLNRDWSAKTGGELVFMGNGDKSISISPLYNRCVLFDPFSKGSEHWVEALNAEYANEYRFNVTSWYWSE